MSDPAKYFYTNAMEVMVSPFDFTFRFLRNVTQKVQHLKPGTSEDAKPFAADEFLIGMSPSHAKAMLPSLYRTIKQYEQKFGKLHLPEELQKIWDEEFGEKS